MFSYVLKQNSMCIDLATWSAIKKQLQTNFTIEAIVNMHLAREIC